MNCQDIRCLVGVVALPPIPPKPARTSDGGRSRAATPSACGAGTLGRGSAQGLRRISCLPWLEPASSRLNPNSEVGHEIERTCRAPSAVGRVTPCAPRLPPAGAKFPRRRLPDPLPIQTLLEFSVPTSFFGLNPASCRLSFRSAAGNIPDVGAKQTHSNCFLDRVISPKSTRATAGGRSRAATPSACGAGTLGRGSAQGLRRISCLPLVEPASSRLNPNWEVGNEIERTCRAPSAVGRVTPCAPRLQPAGAKFPRRRLPDPLPIQTLLEFSLPTSFFGLNPASCRISLRSAAGNIPDVGAKQTHSNCFLDRVISPKSTRATAGGRSRAATPSACGAGTLGRGSAQGLRSGQPRIISPMLARNRPTRTAFWIALFPQSPRAPLRVDEVALRLRLPAEQALWGAAPPKACAGFPASPGWNRLPAG